MGVARATTCKVCGAPRYEKAVTGLCQQHWFEYRRQVARDAYDRQHPGARRYTTTPSTDANRVRLLRRMYDDLRIRQRLDSR
jgi:hypothetical protein